jgi:hypothetical protein
MGARGFTCAAERSAMEWKKSRYCGYNGDCVEVAWRKSSHSASGNCIEVADVRGQVCVRDSKDPDGPVLAFTPAQWDEFLRSLNA